MNHTDTRAQPDMARRNTVIRNIVALTGDITIGIALASACTWLINVAALGIFLSFLMWLITAVLTLAISQYIVNPSVKFLLSDHKLEDAISTASGLYSAFSYLGDQTSQEIWRVVKGGLSSLAGAGVIGSFARRFRPG